MMYQIGDKVFYFEDNLRGELPIKEGVVYGSFVSQKTGDVYYYLKEKQVPAFCVADTDQRARELLARFDAYRTDYMARVDEQTERFNKFKEEFARMDLKDAAPIMEE